MFSGERAAVISSEEGIDVRGTCLSKGARVWLMRCLRSMLLFDSSL